MGAEVGDSSSSEPSRLAVPLLLNGAVTQISEKPYRWRSDTSHRTLAIFRRLAFVDLLDGDDFDIGGDVMRIDDGRRHHALEVADLRRKRHTRRHCRRARRFPVGLCLAGKLPRPPLDQIPGRQRRRRDRLGFGRLHRATFHRVHAVLLDLLAAIRYPGESFQMAYKYDVFISYARAIDVLTGWVSNFERKLAGWLKQKLPGGTANVFLDLGEVGVGPLTPTLEEALSSSAILLIILSNRWLEREWCQKELSAFVEAAGGPENAQERIALVRIEEVKQYRLPQVLRNCHCYDFFTVHPTKKVTLIYGLPEFPNLESDYLLTLLELVGDEDRPGLVTRLVELMGPEVPTGNHVGIKEDERRVIFLADCTPDLNRDRGALKRYLEKRGFQVVPMGTFYHAPPRYEEEFRRLPAKSTVFIQIVGPFRYELTEHFRAGYEVWRLEQARDIMYSVDVLRWRRPDVLRNAVEDEAHREFVFADDVTKCDLEEFKVILDDKLREIDSRRSRTAEQERGRIVLVNAAESDSKMAESVGTKVEDLCVEMDLGSSIFVDLVGEKSSLFDVARNNPCDGLIIVYGECPPEWVRQQRDQCRRVVLMLKTATPFATPFAIYEPEVKPPLDSHSGQFSLTVRGEDGLRNFVRKVVQR